MRYRKNIHKQENVELWSRNKRGYVPLQKPPNMNTNQIVSGPTPKIYVGKAHGRKKLI